jgi:hypothetical protein
MPPSASYRVRDRAIRRMNRGLALRLTVSRLHGSARIFNAMLLMLSANSISFVRHANDVSSKEDFDMVARAIRRLSRLHRLNLRNLLNLWMEFLNQRRSVRYFDRGESPV